jgi:hypothetical protein
MNIRTRSRLRRLVVTVAVTAAAAVGVSTFAAGAANAATGDELASKIAEQHLPYSELSLAPVGPDYATLAFNGSPTWNTPLTWDSYLPTDPNDWSHPEGRFFLVPDGSVLANAVTHPSPGTILYSGKYYTTYRIMNFHATRSGNQVNFDNPLCLDAFGGVGTAGTAVGAYGCDPNTDHQANQLWVRIPDPANPSHYSFVNLDGLNRTNLKDVNTAPRLSIPNYWSRPGQPLNATLQAPTPTADCIQTVTETDHAATFA